MVVHLLMRHRRHTGVRIFPEGHSAVRTLWDIAKWCFAGHNARSKRRVGRGGWNAGRTRSRWRQWAGRRTRSGLWWLGTRFRVVRLRCVDGPKGGKKNEKRDYIIFVDSIVNKCCNRSNKYLGFCVKITTFIIFSYTNNIGSK